MAELCLETVVADFEVHFDMIIAKEDMDRMVSRKMQDLAPGEGPETRPRGPKFGSSYSLEPSFTVP